jgi:hypothetical protein
MQGEVASAVGSLEHLKRIILAEDSASGWNGMVETLLPNTTVAGIWLWCCWVCAS